MLTEYIKDILSEMPIFVFVDLSGVRRIGEVVKVNTATTWVKVRSGAQTFDYIQRHNTKHHVAFYKFGSPYAMIIDYSKSEVRVEAYLKEVQDETLDTPAGE